MIVLHKTFESTKEKDFAILKKVLKGECEAFGELVLKYQNRILSLGYSFFKNEEDAQDFCQDVMFKAYQALPSFKMTSSFYTWLMRIAYNMALNSTQRKQHFTLSSEERDFISPFLSPEEKFIRTCLQSAIKKAVNNLPENYKICIELYFFYDVAYADIEEITGLPKGTIKSYVFRAKRILKTEIEHAGLTNVVTAKAFPYLFCV
ncbi:MAG: RNA polymerase sigma factor [Treponema sp.]